MQPACEVMLQGQAESRNVVFGSRGVWFVIRTKPDSLEIVGEGGGTDLHTAYVRCTYTSSTYGVYTHKNVY